MMPVLDKAVSTEDLCAEEVPPALGVLRLEAILNTLVENKVEALKQENGKNSSLHSSPKSILHKLKCHSSPKTTVRIEDEKSNDPRRKDRKEKSHGHKIVSESKHFKRQVLRQETSSPDSQILHTDDKCPTNGQQLGSPSCMESSCSSHVCYCNHGPVSMQVTDDYISIKMDGYGDVETDAIIAQEELKRARRKKRRRRKRRLKKRLALNPHLVDTLAHDSEFKALNEDELPPRAKWTIVATACLLLFMCLLLVGITLRMAPIIDEIGCKPIQKSKSLEEIYQRKRRRKYKGEQRRQSEFCIRENGIPIYRKKSSRRLKKKSSTHSKTSRNSRNYDVEKGYSESSSHARPRLHSESGTVKSIESSRRNSTPHYPQIQKEEIIRQNRRRKIVNLILGVYILLFCISILSVVVTLTHKSTTTVFDHNSTRNLTYYTFSPNPDVLYEANR